MTPTPDRSAEYLLVRALRQIISGISQNISEATARDYLSKYERMKRNGTTPETAGTKKAFYAYRAALLFGVAADSRQALRARDKATFGSEDWKEAMHILHRSQAIFARYPPDPERKHRNIGSPSSCTWEDIKSHKVKTITGWSATVASKKRILSKLRKDSDWRAKLFAQITPKHQHAAALCALTGARPSEIARGIRVELINDSDGQRLIITIAGSKLTTNSGQPERTIRVKLDTKEARHLAQYAAHNPLYVVTHPANLCAAFIKAGRAAFPLLRETVTPYVLRHALASDLKAAGVSPDAIAQVLGHQASESQQAYGFAVCASGPVSIDGVCATLAVRSTHRRPREHLGMSSPGPSTRY